MAEHYTPEIVLKTATLIQQQFHISDEHAQRLAVAALDGLESHGSSANDWGSIVKTVNVVVASWIKNGYFL